MSELDIYEEGFSDNVKYYRVGKRVTIRAIITESNTDEVAEDIIGFINGLPLKGDKKELSFKEKALKFLKGFWRK